MVIAPEARDYMREKNMIKFISGKCSNATEVEIIGVHFESGICVAV